MLWGNLGHNSLKPDRTRLVWKKWQEKWSWKGNGIFPQIDLFCGLWSVVSWLRIFFGFIFNSLKPSYIDRYTEIPLRVLILAISKRLMNPHQFFNIFSTLWPIFSKRLTLPLCNYIKFTSFFNRNYTSIITQPDV